MGCSMSCLPIVDSCCSEHFHSTPAANPNDYDNPTAPKPFAASAVTAAPLKFSALSLCGLSSVLRGGERNGATDDPNYTDGSRPGGPAELHISHFTASPRDILGQGGFGYVKKATKQVGGDAGTVYAIKVMRKEALLLRRKGVSCVLTELALLQDLHACPFICAAHYAFQDEGHLYLVLEYCSGGDMRYNMTHTSVDRRFTEDATRFYAVQLILALEHCHKLCILHRDVKPENILLTQSGYIKLTDLGVARRVCPPSMECNSSSGTHGYMAPEIYAYPSHTHGPPSDWFSMGVTLHEFATGRRPFDSKLLKACTDGVSVSEFSLHWLHNCDYLSYECQSFISKLLHALENFRMTPRSMRTHPWLAGVDWAATSSCQLTPPQGPMSASSSFCLRSTLTAIDVAKLIAAERKPPSALPPDQQYLFRDYRYRELLEVEEEERKQPTHTTGCRQSGGGSALNSSQGGVTSSEGMTSHSRVLSLDRRHRSSVEYVDNEYQDKENHSSNTHRYISANTMLDLKLLDQNRSHVPVHRVGALPTDRNSFPLLSTPLPLSGHRRGRELFSPSGVRREDDYDFKTFQTTHKQLYKPVPSFDQQYSSSTNNTNNNNSSDLKRQGLFDRDRHTIPPRENAMSSSSIISLSPPPPADDMMSGDDKYECAL